MEHVSKVLNEDSICRELEHLFRLTLSHLNTWGHPSQILDSSKYVNMFGHLCSVLLNMEAGNILSFKTMPVTMAEVQLLKFLQLLKTSLVCKIMIKKKTSQ